MPSAKRTNWGRNYPNIPKLNLIEIQLESWQEFLKTDLEETIKSISPIIDYTGNNWELELINLEFDPISTTPEIARKKGLNYTIPVKVKTRLTNKRTGDVREENVFFLNLPTITNEAVVGRLQISNNYECGFYILPRIISFKLFSFSAFNYFYEYILILCVNYNLFVNRKIEKEL